MHRGESPSSDQALVPPDDRVLTSALRREAGRGSYSPFGRFPTRDEALAIFDPLRPLEDRDPGEADAITRVLRVSPGPACRAPA